MLTDRFWPGPLTVILRRSARVLDEVTGGLPTVGLRVPAAPVALDLLAAFGGGLAAPSANRFGHVSPTTAQAVIDELGDAVDLVLDGGPCRVGVESTIVELTGEAPTVLRPGAVTVAQLEGALGRPVRPPDGPSRAPGMLPSHYAPNAAVEIVAAEALAARDPGAAAAGTAGRHHRAERRPRRGRTHALRAAPGRGRGWGGCDPCGAAGGRGHRSRHRRSPSQGRGTSRVAPPRRWIGPCQRAMTTAATMAATTSTISRLMRMLRPRCELGVFHLDGRDRTGRSGGVRGSLGLHDCRGGRRGRESPARLGGRGTDLVDRRGLDCRSHLFERGRDLRRDDKRRWRLPSRVGAERRGTTAEAREAWAPVEAPVGWAGTRRWSAQMRPSTTHQRLEV